METENKLPAEFKEKWIAALRSGKYKQGSLQLYNQYDNSYCCLGVAGEISGCYNLQGSYLTDRSKYAMIPKLIKGDWSNAIVKILTDMNDGRLPDQTIRDDQKKSFLEIAQYIEDNL